LNIFQKLNLKIMTKRSTSNPDKNQSSGVDRGKNSRRTPLWQALILPIASIIIFSFLLEGGLALFGVKPALQTEDPFVGFSTNVPLFVPSKGPAGKEIMTTAHNKRGFFNQQSFPKEKSPGTYRIFCLGGSTTYGRPYNDATSFSGWLRELLPAADRNKNWEVINAGGISYASYRVAHLMEELVNYQPDLFIVYTGHNEFLEERTYSQIKNIPPMVRSVVSLLAKTRTWSAMSEILKQVGIHPDAKKERREQLRGEVNAILDRSAGLNRYTRDDRLRDNILEHYRISLERMVALARSVNARIIFVTPASNLKDFSPFKSEYTEGLDKAAQKRSAQMLAQAKEAINKADWQDASAILEKAVALDPRNAELQYRRGQALLALKRYDDAEMAFRLARDEDVCPLRALTQMRRIVLEIAREQGVGVVDFVDLLEKRMQDKYGYRIYGKEFFLDHVHPSVGGHEILALALIRAMIDEKIVHPGPDWGEQAVETVAAKIEGRIDRHVQGQALANLARVLLWAGKTDDAERLARQALAKAPDDEKIAENVVTTMVRISQKRGDTERAIQQLYSAIEKFPTTPEPRYMLGTALLEDGPSMQLEKAAASLLLICKWTPFDDGAFQYFAKAMAKRGRLRIAYNSFAEALRLNPNNVDVKKTLENFPRLPDGRLPTPQKFVIVMDVYPSSVVHKLVQMRFDNNGRPIRDGIEVEFYENGRIKRFLDIDQGRPDGVEMTWDKEGRLLSRVEYKQGKVVK